MILEDPCQTVYDYNDVLAAIGNMILQEGKHRCQDCSTSNEMHATREIMITSSLERVLLDDERMGDVELWFRICEWMCEVRQNI